jgi:hypothetical protein
MLRLTNKTSNRERLTKRDGFWHYVRRIPPEFAEYDKRGIVRHQGAHRRRTE